MVNEVAIGQPLEGALWKLHERVGLPEYAFFAVTIGLQAQTGGSLVETLQNLQDLVRKRVALSKRGKALAAEARMSAMILGALPFCRLVIVLASCKPGFLDFFFSTPTGNHLLLVAIGFHGHGHLCDASTDPPEPRAVTHDQLLAAVHHSAAASWRWSRPHSCCFSRAPVSRRLRAVSAGCARARQWSDRSSSRFWPAPWFRWCGRLGMRHA